MKRFNYILTIFLIMFSVFSVFGCNSNDKDYYIRRPTHTDVRIEQDPSGLLSMKFLVIPQKDIVDLCVSFSFFDSNNKPIIKKTKQMGDVIKGNQYTIQLPLSEFTASQLLKISRYKTQFFRGIITISQEKQGLCLMHNFNQTKIKEATCDAEGEILHTCKNCNYKQTEIISYKNHNFIKLDSTYYICTDCCVRSQYPL